MPEELEIFLNWISYIYFFLVGIFIFLCRCLNDENVSERTPSIFVTLSVLYLFYYRIKCYEINCLLKSKIKKIYIYAYVCICIDKPTHHLPFRNYFNVFHVHVFAPLLSFLMLLKNSRVLVVPVCFGKLEFLTLINIVAHFSLHNFTSPPLNLALFRVIFSLLFQ